MRDMTVLLSKVGKLNADEREVIEFLVDGLLVGQYTYGKLDISSDPRDYIDEFSEEARDGLLYLSMQIVRRRRLKER